MTLRRSDRRRPGARLARLRWRTCQRAAIDRVRCRDRRQRRGRRHQRRAADRFGPGRRHRRRRAAQVESRLPPARVRSLSRRCTRRAASRKTADKAITILQGRCVGGSTTVNWTSSFRTPSATLAYWRQHFGLDDQFTDDALAPWFLRAEQRLNIGPWLAPPNENNELLRQGALKLGIAAAAILRNVKGCWNLGSCGLGCPTNAKQSMLVTTLPVALDRGATLLEQTRVVQLEIRQDRVVALQCVAVAAERRRAGGGAHAHQRAPCRRRRRRHQLAGAAAALQRARPARRARHAHLPASGRAVGGHLRSRGRRVARRAPDDLQRSLPRRCTRSTDPSATSSKRRRCTR